MDSSNIVTHRNPVANQVSPAAFIIYRPETKPAKNSVFYNEEAWRILSFSISDITEKKGKAPFPDISAFCSKWKGLYDKILAEQNITSQDGNREVFIDVFQSHRRKYAVRAIELSGNPSNIQKHEKQYLFTLERVCHNNVNLSKNIRQWSLNKREQEIVQLILADRCNKEIAGALGLSLNTVKGYLKLLMRKLGASSRAGIISILLTGKPSQSS
ncbi:MAG TPA: response regulator transcription factor [Candidatus Wunengus sp. YC60]|uniref:response regulator transcription factor n=1 Tax=Candidatus Wunengus sp. YC60 TaxID=3367697 RepID=UPI0040264934